MNLRDRVNVKTYQDALNEFKSMTECDLMWVLGEAKGASVFKQLQEPFIQEVIDGVSEVFKERTVDNT
jgi:hypothetical protein